MNINLEKTLKAIENKLNPVEEINLDKLYKAFDYATRLRSQLLSVIYEMEHGVTSGLADHLTEGFTDGKIVTLTIQEPLPIEKYMTNAVQEHWIELMQTAIHKATQDRKNPYFEKAFVWIEVSTPKYTDNAKLWDTSNRAINMIINHLKGVFFKDDNHENMAFGVIGNWGETGTTVVHILPFDEINKLITDFIKGTKSEFAETS